MLLHLVPGGARASLGLSGIIGVALLINTTRSGKTRVDLEPWPMFRLFVTPFCVSSFSALVKGKNFWLVFSPRESDLLAGVALIAAFCGAVLLAKLAVRRRRQVHHGDTEGTEKES